MKTDFQHNLTHALMNQIDAIRQAERSLERARQELIEVLRLACEDLDVMADPDLFDALAETVNEADAAGYHLGRVSKLMKQYDYHRRHYFSNPFRRNEARSRLSKTTDLAALRALVNKWHGSRKKLKVVG